MRVNVFASLNFLESFSVDNEWVGIDYSGLFREKAPPMAVDQATMFPLLRYFSIAGAIVVGLATVVVAIIMTKATEQQLVAQREASNVALAKAFSNSIWSEFRYHVQEVADLNGGELRAHPGTKHLYSAVQRLMKDLSIVKVKIYALNGNTVFSTEAGQMGSSKAGKPGFIKSSNGEVATEISHRDRFSAFEQEVFGIDVVSSYIPIFDRAGKVESVFEVYDDVTATLDAIRAERNRTILAIAALFAGLYLILFLIVRHAANLMRQQHEEMHAAKVELLEINAQFADEVATRIMTEEALRESHATLEASEAEARKLLAKVSETSEALAIERKENEMQRQFVSVVSHEFRTPLAIIDGAANRLSRKLNEPAHERLQQMIGKIRNAVSRMTELIDDTLSSDKAYSERLALSLKECSIQALIAEVCDRQQSVSPDYHITTDFGDLPDAIIADDKQLDHVFTNLLSNAVKYSPESRTCHVACCRAGSDVLITVSDSGVGISAQELPKLFQRFFRASSAVGIAGTGIGLNLVKKLVDMHGGEISVASELGRGSAFTVRLPIAGPDAIAEAAA